MAVSPDWFEADEFVSWAVAIPDQQRIRRIDRRGRFAGHALG
jgi:hypothetical protein